MPGKSSETAEHALTGGARVPIISLKSEAQRPPGTALLFEVRAASRRDGLSQKKWQAVKEGSFQLEATDRALQYRAIFKSDNGDRFPILDRVTVQLRP